jgi:hypothetical protein
MQPHVNIDKPSLSACDEASFSFSHKDKPDVMVGLIFSPLPEAQVLMKKNAQGNMVINIPQLPLGVDLSKPLWQIYTVVSRYVNISYLAFTGIVYDMAPSIDSLSTLAQKHPIQFDEQLTNTFSVETLYLFFEKERFRRLSRGAPSFGGLHCATFGRQFSAVVLKEESRPLGRKHLAPLLQLAVWFAVKKLGFTRPIGRYGSDDKSRLNLFHWFHDTLKHQDPSVYQALEKKLNISGRSTYTVARQSH